jgi:N6-L-threonylcarbamoyladenine synthase
MLGRPDANFSLSGLKTAVRQVAEQHTPLTGDVVNDLCAGFQAAVIDSTVDRLKAGLRLFHETIGTAPTALVAAGGVAANAAIRAALNGAASHAGIPLLLPPPNLCTDNGAMIAWAGAERLALGLDDGLDSAPRARWRLDETAAVPQKFANTRANF